MEQQFITTGLALVAVAFGSLLTYLSSSAQYRRQQAAERTKRRAEKFEELVAVLYEHKHWLSTVRGIRVVGLAGEETISPFPRAEAIVTAYFPDFREQFRELDMKADAYELWMMECAELRLAGADVSVLTKGHMDVLGPYQTAFHVLTSRLHHFAEAEFR